MPFLELRYRAAHAIHLVVPQLPRMHLVRSRSSIFGDIENGKTSCGCTTFFGSSSSNINQRLEFYPVTRSIVSRKDVAKMTQVVLDAHVWIVVKMMNVPIAIPFCFFQCVHLFHSWLVKFKMKPFPLFNKTFGLSEIENETFHFSTFGLFEISNESIALFNFSAFRNGKWNLSTF